MSLDAFKTLFFSSLDSNNISLGNSATAFDILYASALPETARPNVQEMALPISLSFDLSIAEDPPKFRCAPYRISVQLPRRKILIYVIIKKTSIPSFM